MKSWARTMAVTKACTVSGRFWMVSCSVSAAMPGTSPPMNSCHEASVVASKIGTPQPSSRACSIIDMVAMVADTEPVLRSEEHTSELQSRENLVCRLLLEKKRHQCMMGYD